MDGLYLIADADICAAAGHDLLDVALALLRTRPALLQVRAKRTPTDQVLRWLVALREPARAAGVALIANDRPDLAALAGCDGVHLGQDDVPFERARQLASGLRIGLSTHSLEQLARALQKRPDYVAYGPVFPTASKQNPDACVGVDGLAAAHRLCLQASVPLVAIGGINASRAAEVSAHCEWIAVIGACMARQLEQVPQRVARLRRAVESKRTEP